MLLLLLLLLQRPDSAKTIPAIDEFCRLQKRELADSEALKFHNVPSGACGRRRKKKKFDSFDNSYGVKMTLNRFSVEMLLFARRWKSEQLFSGDSGGCRNERASGRGRK